MSENNGHAPKKKPQKNQPPKFKQPAQVDVVGTAEAAAILGVERTRIGKWRQRGIMPPTVQELQATPLWRRRDVERLRPWVEKNRRSPARDEAPVAA